MNFNYVIFIFAGHCLAMRDRRMCWKWWRREVCHFV